jgi:tRNA1(Val) A37 N6-methylase TrmN6
VFEPADPEVRARCRGLELGAGLGACGIFAAHLGLQVTITDNSQEVLQLIGHNVQMNLKLYPNDIPAVSHLDWDDLSEHLAAYEFVFASGR